MRRFFKSNGALLALFVFLPVTPSIAAISVFTHSLLRGRSNEVTSIPHDAKRVLNAISH